MAQAEERVRSSIPEIERAAKDQQDPLLMQKFKKHREQQTKQVIESNQ